VRGPGHRETVAKSASRGGTLERAGDVDVRAFETIEIGRHQRGGDGREPTPATRARSAESSRDWPNGRSHRESSNVGT
jgi:hypothetical protein